MKRILFPNAILLVFFFVYWCVLDYFAVKSPRYPASCNDDEWTFYLIPLLTVAVNLLAQRGQGLKKVLLTTILATVVVCVLSVLLVLFFGVPYHLMIGGRM
jgi:ABC-type antimicrobial peptide transport system permease subunit